MVILASGRCFVYLWMLHVHFHTFINAVTSILQDLLWMSVTVHLRWCLCQRWFHWWHYYSERERASEVMLVERGGECLRDTGWVERAVRFLLPKLWSDTSHHLAEKPKDVLLNSGDFILLSKTLKIKDAFQLIVMYKGSDLVMLCIIFKFYFPVKCCIMYISFHKQQYAFY